MNFGGLVFCWSFDFGFFFRLACGCGVKVCFEVSFVEFYFDRGGGYVWVFFFVFLC